MIMMADYLQCTYAYTEFTSSSKNRHADVMMRTQHFQFNDATVLLELNSTFLSFKHILEVYGILVLLLF